MVRGSCVSLGHWELLEGILIPCPVQGGVSAGVNIPMRLVCQKLLDLGNTWKKPKGEGRTLVLLKWSAEPPALWSC